MMKRVWSLSVFTLLVISSLTAANTNDNKMLFGEWSVTNYDLNIDFDFTPAIDKETLDLLRSDLEEEWQLDPDMLDFKAVVKSDSQLEVIYDNSYDGEGEDVNVCSYKVTNGLITLDCGSFLGLDFKVSGNYNKENDKIIITIDNIIIVNIPKFTYLIFCSTY